MYSRNDTEISLNLNFSETVSTIYNPPKDGNNSHVILSVCSHGSGSFVLEILKKTNDSKDYIFFFFI